VHRVRLTGRRREELLAICNEEDTDGRAWITMEEERVMHVHVN